MAAPNLKEFSRKSMNMFGRCLMLVLLCTLTAAGLVGEKHGGSLGQICFATRGPQFSPHPCGGSKRDWV